MVTTKTSALANLTPFLLIRIIYSCKIRHRVAISPSLMLARSLSSVHIYFTPWSNWLAIA